MNWKNPTTTSLVFSIYVFVAGASLLLLPTFIPSLTGLSIPQDVWVRVTGAIAVALSYYYFDAARRNNLAFIESTVIGRAIFAIAITGLIVFGYAPINMIIFPIIDLLGAAWSFYALREMKKG